MSSVMTAADVSARPRNKTGAKFWVSIFAGVLLVGAAFHDAIYQMVDTWLVNEEYSHGILMPFIAAFLIWQRKDILMQHMGSGSWSGLVLVVVGATFGLVARMAAVYAMQQYSMLIVLSGLCVCFGGWRLLRPLTAPIAVLFLMVPLPSFLISNLSAQLQLFSSQIGVWVVRAFGISVYLEGNVIDLGPYKLQVAEACSGLRYLFPLMTLAFVMAYFFKASLWKRALIVISSFPVTVLMNSFRIGLIGVTVEHYGVAAAEGLLHDFEGWVVFMASGAVLVGEMILLSRFDKDGRSWRDRFGLTLTREVVHPSGTAIDMQWSVSRNYVAALFVVGLLAVTSLQPARAERVVSRESLLLFPNVISDWTGRSESMDPIYIDALKLNDYALLNYSNKTGDSINLYVAWYNSQRAGQSAHSPRTCLPGGGWRLRSLDTYRIGDAESGFKLKVNRALIQQGQQQQLVYYWFQQRGRVVANEYLVKWYLFWDALMRNRTDGALVRLVMPLQNNSEINAADLRLAQFASRISKELPRFVPN